MVGAEWIVTDDGRYIPVDVQTDLASIVDGARVLVRKNRDHIVAARALLGRIRFTLDRRGGWPPGAWSVH